MSTLDAFTERINEWQGRLPWAAEYTPIVVAAIAELAAGEPVEVRRVAERAGVPAASALEFLRSTPAEFDPDGRLVGLGLTLLPTPHRVELEGRRLYTWCAPDTLELPALLGKPVRIESPCHATGEPVRIEADTHGVHKLEPEQAVVSIMLADACTSDFRERICEQNHFFCSEAAAADWHAERPEAIVVPVRLGFVLAQAMVAPWLGSEAIDDGFDRALAELPSCALDGPARAAQHARYARLAPSTTGVRREPDAVVIEFDHHLDAELLDEAIAVERDCCPFLSFELDRRSRRVRVTVSDPEMRPALDALADGFRAAQRRMESAQ
jgi:alkylmercury lyase